MKETIMVDGSYPPRRPTIADLAREAGVSVATIDRVLNGRHAVRERTAARVLGAAEALGYHATGLLRARLQPPVAERTLGFLLQRRSSDFYRALGLELERATATAPGVHARPIVEFADELSPTRIVECLQRLGARADVLAVVAVDHPRVSTEIERLRNAGVPTLALLSDLGTPLRAGYVGLDARRAGRTAAWAIRRLARRSGEVALFVGSHRYLDHELREISLKTYLREHAPEFHVLEPVVDLEDEAVAHAAAITLIERHPDLVGIYSVGGGVEGIADALREKGRSTQVVFVCNELTPASRAGLLDGAIDLVIATPTARLARRAVAAMLAAVADPNGIGVAPDFVPLELVGPENL
jgi:LacI family transcriptional regulator